MVAECRKGALPGPADVRGGSAADPGKRSTCAFRARCGEEVDRGGHRAATRHRALLFRQIATLGASLTLACTTHDWTNPSLAAGAEPDAADAVEPPTDAAPEFPGDGWIAHLALGATATASSGLSPASRFWLPEGTTALQVTLTAPRGHLLQLAELTGDGAPIVPGDWLQKAQQPWLSLGAGQRVRATAWQAAFLIANAPDVPLLPGPWQLRAFAFDYDPATEARQPTATTLDVDVTLLRKPSAAHGSIALNLCLSGARGITAANALAHPRVIAALARGRATWAKAGIDVSEVRAFDVPVAALDVAHDDGEDLEFAALLRLAAGQPDGIPIFLMETVELRTTTGIVSAAGLTAGLPSPTSMGGPRTGMALALQYDAPDLLGVVMAHEIGHFLGLFHVVEAASPGQEPITDPLTDTLATPDNLMYYAPTPSQLGLTPQQGAVARAGPWVTP